MTTHLGTVTLGVLDLATSVKFDPLGLGFLKMESLPEIVLCTLDGAWQGLYRREAFAADATVATDGGGWSGFAVAHNV